MASIPSFIAPLGPDGIPTDVPLIAFTEKCLEEKEQQLRKYIQENYSKIQNVERELSSLALELKLTAGPKKAALEHLRRKIEISTEKIKVAKRKEEQARKDWETALNILKKEEEVKQRLCEDLNQLVQESAAVQYARLEELKQRLEALNPESGGVASVPASSEHGSEMKMPIHKKEEAGNSREQVDGKCIPEMNGKLNHQLASRHDKDVAQTQSSNCSQALDNHGSANASNRQGNKVVSSKGRGKARHPLVNQKLKGNTWTGAGFDVDDTGFTG